VADLRPLLHSRFRTSASCIRSAGARTINRSSRRISQTRRHADGAAQRIRRRVDGKNSCAPCRSTIALPKPASTRRSARAARIQQFNGDPAEQAESLLRPIAERLISPVAVYPSTMGTWSSTFDDGNARVLDEHARRQVPLCVGNDMASLFRASMSARHHARAGAGGRYRAVMDIARAGETADARNASAHRWRGRCDQRGPGTVQIPQADLDDRQPVDELHESAATDIDDATQAATAPRMSMRSVS